MRLVEVPKPRPASDAPLVRVVAAALNPKDVSIREGRYKIVSGCQFPKNIGVDFSGVVASPGAGLVAGQRVFGMLNELQYQRGTVADFVAPMADEVCPLPDGIDFAEAAAMPLVALTALQAMRDVARLQPGQSVLINGASGGVGTVAIQIARLLGAGHVTTLSSAPRVKACEMLGAHEALDYEHRDSLLRSARFDVVFDTFGNFHFDQVRGALKARGCFVSTAMTPGRMVRDTLLRCGAQQERYVAVAANRLDLGQIGAWMHAQQLSAVVAARFPLDEAVRAFALLESKKAYGKVVVDVLPTG